MMAAPIPLGKTPLICMADLIAPSPQQANNSQSPGQRGEELSESQHLIGDGPTDWMTEKVDLCSHLPSTGSSPSSSIPASPLEHDVQVPSDLEVMTSLLQEELAQLEDYFLSESNPTKVEKVQRCDKGLQAMGTQSYYQLPYASYSSNQSETNPLLVTLATGELDLVGFCGGPVGRPKMSRPAPYNYIRSYYNGRRIATNGFKEGEDLENDVWRSKGSYSGNEELAVDQCSLDKTLGKNPGNAKKVRECATLLKEEEKFCFTEDVFCSTGMTRGYGIGGPLDTRHKKEGQLMHGMKTVGCHEGTEIQLLQCNADGGDSEFKETETAGCYFHQTTAHVEPYHGFVDAGDHSVRVGAMESQNNHYSYHECLGDQSFECLSGGDSVGSTLESPTHRPVQRPKEDPFTLKPDLTAISLGPNHGERKQKKRDQNKTAAHRYRQRKRVELDILEEELHGLEGRNRELRDKAESVEREIQYVKDLLIEVYKTRSQRLKDDTSA